MSSSLNRIEISRAALRHNFRLCQRKAGASSVMPMIKADGYGHGMLECAKVFAEEGAAAFGVAEVVEGEVLRKAGFTQPIFVVVGLLPEILPGVVKYDLTPVVVDGEILPRLSELAMEMGKEVGLHVKIDAGMGRQGCLPEELPGLVDLVEKLPSVYLQGVMAHFPMADEPESDNTLAVFNRFTEALVKLEGRIPSDCIHHIANSGGLFHFDKTCLQMVRPGISLYGCYPEGASHEFIEGEDRLRPVMRYVTRVIQTRSVPVGTGLGYGQTFVTRRETRIAILPVGYEDGYLRSLSSLGKVLIHGRRYPVVGRVSMNLTLVDITDGGNSIQKGDEAVLMGKQGENEITADEIAGWMKTISYEVLCLFGNLNRRIYLDD